MLKIPDTGVLSTIAFHEKAGQSQVSSWLFLLGKLFLPPSSHCRHASIRTLEERFLFRSVHVGRSRFSRCCNLILDLQFRPNGWNLGQAIDAVTGTRLWLLPVFLPGTVLFLPFVLCRYCNCHSLAVVQRFVDLSAPP